MNAAMPSTPSTPSSPTAPGASGAPASGATAATPRVRAGAVLWGLFSMTVAIAVLSTAADADRRSALVAWATGLSTGDVLGLVAIAVGVLILLISSLGALNRSRRRRES